jgi:hypothetical protein
MCDMSTGPDVQDGAVPSETAADFGGNAAACPPTRPEQIYEQATARLAVILDEWPKVRDVLLRG